LGIFRYLRDFLVAVVYLHGYYCGWLLGRGLVG